MCGRFTLFTPRRVIEQRLGVDLSRLASKPRYNIVPGQDVLTLVSAKEGHRRAVLMRWGLIPALSRDARAARSSINAEIETVDVAPLYRASFQRSRCLIVADGFYQWKLARSTAGVRFGVDTPYWVGRSDGAPFAFAGLYAVWHGRNERTELHKCAILTEPASHTLERVHERMPVILHPDRWDAWIDAEQKDVSAIRDVLLSDPSALRFHPVSALVNSPDNDGPELIREVL